MNKLILCAILGAMPLLSIAQEDTTATTASAETTESLMRNPDDYPYRLPIFGKKAWAKGYNILLPLGLNPNFTYNAIDLNVTEFSMTLGDDPNSAVNELLGTYVNEQTLNFQTTTASSYGLNLRFDVTPFPFMSVYGIYASNQGNTSVSLQPEWYDENGNLVLSLPEFSSEVDFSANTGGIGMTLLGGLGNYFFSLDGNYTQSRSELLDRPAKLVTASARVGNRIQFKNKMNLAVYVGGMFREFVDVNGSNGSIKLNVVLPELGQNAYAAIDEKMAANQAEIDALNPNNPVQNAQIAVLESKNEALGEIEEAIQTVSETSVNYFIKKDLVQNWSVQFGFNFQFNPHWMFRSEIGYVTGNTFVLTGIQYRFGLFPKK